MELKSHVILNVNADEYYHKRYPRWNPRAKANVTCPYHEDTNESLSLSLNNGGAKCHAASCGKAFGNIVHYEATLKDISELEAASSLYSEFVRPVIAETILAMLQKELLASKQWLRWIEKECGFDSQVVKSFGLGLDLHTKRIIIPVRDQWGQLVNFRKYRIPRFRKTKQDDSMKVLNEDGHGNLDLFPFDKFVSYSLDKPIFIMASEKETMIAINHGLQAICSTNGAIGKEK